MKNSDFLIKVKNLIGISYNECDCAGVIRKSLNIAFSGTNWLFRSINNSSKYRYLKERHACGDGSTPPPGAVVFKTDETKTPEGYSTVPDAYHCGVVDEDGYVIHSSPKTGVTKDMTSRWMEWDYWGLMKQVEYTDLVTTNIVNDLSDMSDRQLLEAIYRSLYSID